MGQHVKPQEALARRFHDTYERLAPKFGYETRRDTKEFDPQSANGQLMQAVCQEVVSTDVLIIYRKLFNNGLVASRVVLMPPGLKGQTLLDYQREQIAKEKERLSKQMPEFATAIWTSEIQPLRLD